MLIDNPENLEDIRKRETDITKERIKKILTAGANVVLVTGGIDDQNLKPFIDAGLNFETRFSTYLHLVCSMLYILG